MNEQVINMLLEGIKDTLYMTLASVNKEKMTGITM